MKILLTGGAGFIGSHVAQRLLRRGDTVVVVDELNDYYDTRQKMANLEILSLEAETARDNSDLPSIGELSNYDFIQADCADMHAMKAIFHQQTTPIDVVIHLAARAGVRPSIRDPHMYIHANITATTTLLECARTYGVRHFLYASSSSVYGGNVKVPFSEQDPTDKPVSPYAASKKACELMAATYNHLYQLPVTGLRFFTVYGPRGRPDMAPFLFVDRIARGIPIDKFGDGSSSRDYTFIDDIVDGVLACVDRNPLPSDPPRIYNLGNSQTVSLNEFIRVVEDCVGNQAIINHKPMQPGDVHTTFADVTLAKQELNYQPKWSIEAGIRELVSWYTAYNSVVPMKRALSSDSVSSMETPFKRVREVQGETPPPSPPRTGVCLYS